MSLLLREALGKSLRRMRVSQSRTLRDVSAQAQVSLGYLSEVERGRKEASSELLASICRALNVSLTQVLSQASDTLVHGEPETLGDSLGHAVVDSAADKPSILQDRVTMSVASRIVIPAPSVRSHVHA